MGLILRYITANSYSICVVNPSVVPWLQQRKKRLGRCCCLGQRVDCKFAVQKTWRLAIYDLSIPMEPLAPSCPLNTQAINVDMSVREIHELFIADLLERRL
jgi:hypothetical protein